MSDLISLNSYKKDKERKAVETVIKNDLVTLLHVYRLTRKALGYYEKKYLPVKRICYILDEHINLFEIKLKSIAEEKNHGKD